MLPSAPSSMLAVLLDAEYHYFSGMAQDPWDFVEPFDVIAKKPSKFDGEEGIDSKKWTERKDALQGLLDLLTANIRLCPKANYSELVGLLKRILEKDANINVQALAAKCIAKIASGLRTKFAPHVATVTVVIFDKMKEKKPLLKDPLVEAIDAVHSSTTLEAMEADVDAALKKPNPQIKQQTALFCRRALVKYTSSTMPKKTLKALAPVLLTADPDGDVREAACSALGAAMAVIGEKPALSLMGDIASDAAKVAKIKEHSDKISAELDKEAALKPKPSPPTSTNSVAPTMDSLQEQIEQPAEEADPWDFVEPFDVIAKMPSKFEGEEGIDSKKWTERKDALQGLLELLTSNVRLCSKANYSELVGLLKRILEKDANINVQALAAKCIAKIASGLRTKFAPHVATVTVVIFDKMKEKKPLLKDPLVEAIDAVHSSTTLEAMEADVDAALKKPNPQIKQQTALFCRRALVKYTSSTMPKKTLKALAPVLLTADPDGDVREAACSALGAAMAVIGEKPALSLMGDIASDAAKVAKIKEQSEKMASEVKRDPAAPQPPPKNVEPTVKSKPGPANTRQKGDDQEDIEQPVPKPPVKKAAPKEEPVEGEEEVTKKKTEEVIAVNEEKKQRLKDEKTLKILKWNFAAPDDEHTTQLMTLLGAQAKASLVSMLFHKDFKMHLKAMDEFNKVADCQPEALVKNSDLILKWCTLRFFETNPAALIKVLELALKVLQLCLEVDEPMSSEEVSAFVPYLLLKAGEQKENMRAVVREIMDVLSTICGPLKLCPFLIDALKTKNSRQRTECLMVLDKHVATVGLAQLKAQGIVKAMAGCVGDRDTAVRNAAINGMVTCYREDGEKIWQQAGKMEDKDKNMVEERIKRSGAAPGSARPQLPPGATPAKGARIVSENNRSAIRGRDASRDGSRTRDSSPVSSRQLNSTFNADEDATPRVAINSTYNVPSRRFALDDISMENASGGPDSMTLSQVIERLDQVELAQPGKYSNGPSLKRSNSVSSIGSSVVDTLDALDRVIQNVSSGQAELCIESLEQLTYILGVDEQRPLLLERISLLLPAIASQVKLIRNFVDRQVEERIGERIKSILNFLTNLTSISGGLKRANGASLEPLLYELISALDDAKLKELHDSENIIRSINKVVIRSCTLTDPNAFFFAVTTCMKRDLERDHHGTVSLFTKCLMKFATDIRENIDMDELATAANAFYQSCPARERPSPVHEDALKSVALAVEKAFLANKAHGREAFSRLRTVDPRLGALVDELVKSVSSGGLHSHVIALIKDLDNMSKNIPMLADYMEGKASERAGLERQLREKVPMGDLFLSLVDEYLQFRAGRAEFPPCYPSPSVVALMKDAMVLCLPSLAFLGSEASSILPSGSSTMSHSVSAPSLPAPTPSVEVIPGSAAKPKRRTMNPADLAPLKERLNQISGDN